MGLLVNSRESAKACVYTWLCVPAPGMGPGMKRAVLCLLEQLFHSLKLFFKIWRVGWEKKKLLPLHFTTLLVPTGCKIWTRWQSRIWRQTGGLAGFLPHFQSLHKHYVNLWNFCEMLPVSPLHAQENSGEDCVDQPKECRASTRLAELGSRLWAYLNPLCGAEHS